MTPPDNQQSMLLLVQQMFIGYLIFALTATSISMFITAPHMKAMLRGYLMSVTFMAAAIVIYYYAVVYDSLAGIGAMVAVFGPWTYQRAFASKKK